MKTLKAYRKMWSNGILLLLIMVSGWTQSFASHILGGDLRYSYTGTANLYNINLTLYGDCNLNNSPFTDLFTLSQRVEIYNGTALASTLYLTPQPNTGMNVTPVCSAFANQTSCENINSTLKGVAKFEYAGVASLAPSSNWNIYFTGVSNGNSQAGRSSVITNLSNVGIFTLLTTLDNSSGPNSSPIFNNQIPPYSCPNSPMSYNPSVVDPDGDQLQFESVIPLTPNGLVTYNTGYSNLQPIATTTGVTLDPNTGQLSFTSSMQQTSAVTFKITERRNGIIIGTCMREFNFTSLPCTNNPPNGSPTNITGGTSMNTVGGNSIAVCQGTASVSFQVNPVDAQNENITMTLINSPAGLSSSITGNGTPTPHASFTWNTASLTPGTYTFFVRYQDDACPLSNIQDVAYSVVILNPMVGQVITGPTPICPGQTVTYSVPPETYPTTYSWTLPSGWTGSSTTNSITATSGLNSGNITVTATSFGCSGAPLAKAVTVLPPVVPSVSITSSSPNGVCIGSSVTFTANVINGGTSPTFQWKVNGNNVGGNTSTYTYVPTNGDVVSVSIASNIQCAFPLSVNSNSITMVVVNPVTPTVSLSVLDTNVCSGTAAYFTATATNTGTAPVYQWKVNGNNVGTNSPTYNPTNLNNGDVVSVVLTSSLGCVTTNNVVSNSIPMHVAITLVPSVTITTSTGSNNSCAGAPFTLTANPVYGSLTPTYQWKKNGTNITGATNSTYTYVPAHGDVITVSLTSSYICAIPATVTAPNLTINVLPVLVPNITIANNATKWYVCDVEPVNFNATAVNQGTSPVYQWYINNTPVGTNSTTFVPTILQNQDVITVVMTSSYMCPDKPKDTSNAITMTVFPSVTPEVTISSDHPTNKACHNEVVHFSAIITHPGMNYSVQWKVNGLPVGANNLDYYNNTLQNGDIVTCEFASDALCKTKSLDTSNSITMTIFTPTKPIVTRNQNLLTSSNAVTYQWFKGNVLLNGETNQTMNVTENGTYFVQVTDSNGCVSESEAVIMQYVSGVGNISAVYNLNVYPNPSTGIVNIHTTKEVSLTVYNAIGQLITTKEVKNKDQIQLNVDGNYLFVFRNSDGVVIERMKLQKVTQ